VLPLPSLSKGRGALPPVMHPVPASLVTFSETDKVKFSGMQVYNIRKLHFQANMCEVLPEIGSSTTVET